MATVARAATDDVAMVNSGETLVPAATVTEAGTVALGSLLERLTLMPPAGAGPFRLTLFNVLETPPTKDAGERVTEDKATGFTVKIAVLVVPL